MTLSKITFEIGVWKNSKMLKLSINVKYIFLLSVKKNYQLKDYTRLNNHDCFLAYCVKYNVISQMIVQSELTNLTKN